MISIMNSINEAFASLPSKMDSKEARLMLLAIGLQESRFQHRRQLVGNPPRPTGPATGFWQFERGGGVVGVLQHRASRDHARNLCAVRGVEPVSQSVWQALQHDDVLAAGFARLLMWTDPFALPKLGDVNGAWDLYMRTSRPGKPHRSTWNDFYAQAQDLVNGAH